MQEPEVEVLFCDLCGTSVPAADIESGRAVQHAGKTIGVCCLPTLRGGEAVPVPAAKAATDAAATGSPRPVSGEGGRLMTVAIVLLVAVAGAVLFLDSRLASVEQALEQSQVQADERRQSDSDVLLGVDVKLDRAAQRQDVDAATAKVGEVAAAVERLQDATGQRIDGVQQEVDALRRELRTASRSAVDYRPLFEDLRERQQRQLAAIEAMRALQLTEPKPAAPAPVVEAVTSDALASLPPELAEQVRKLGAEDPAVRFEAVDVLGSSKNAEVLPHVLPLSKDPDAFVRRLTVEVLREFHKPDAVEALLAGLDDDDEYVRDTAWRSLRHLTGQKLPFEPAASRDGRKRAVQRWREWWQTAKTTFGA